jgi:ABC-type dipeptide/oligopeptide/nickel transport system permease subunit
MRWQIVTILFFVFIALLAPFLTRQDPMHANENAQLQPPNTEHLLGTDLLGRDVMTRLLYGGRRTMLTAAIATILAAIIGAALGIGSAIANAIGDQIISAGINIFLAFPTILIALIILTIWNVGPLQVAIAAGFSQIGAFARVSRTTAHQVRSQLFVESGYAIGATRWHIVRFYILPNAQATLFAYTAVTFCYCLLNSATLNFLGLGGEPGVADWGVMLAEGRAAFLQAPWISFAPGLAITLLVSAIISLVNQVNANNYSAIANLD